jgi:hypothetical protein
MMTDEGIQAVVNLRPDAHNLQETLKQHRDSLEDDFDWASLDAACSTDKDLVDAIATFGGLLYDHPEYTFDNLMTVYRTAGGPKLLSDLNFYSDNPDLMDAGSVETRKEFEEEINQILHVNVDQGVMGDNNDAADH